MGIDVTRAVRLDEIGNVATERLSHAVHHVPIRHS
jgi:hypothetical protein